MNFMQGQVQRENGHVKVRVGDFDLSPAESDAAAAEII